MYIIGLEVACCPALRLIESEARTVYYIHKIIHSMIEAIQRDAESEVNLERRRVAYKKQTVCFLRLQGDSGGRIPWLG